MVENVILAKDQRPQGSAAGQTGSDTWFSTLVCTLLSFEEFYYIFICSCYMHACVCVGTYVLQCKCEGRKTTVHSWFSPNVWVLGIQLWVIMSHLSSLQSFLASGASVAVVKLRFQGWCEKAEVCTQVLGVAVRNRVIGTLE